MSDKHTHDEHENIETQENMTQSAEAAQAAHTDDEYNALLDKYQRLQAEFINYKNRTEAEKKEFATFANKNMILHLLPSIDSLNKAIQSLPEDLATHTWIEGFHQFAKQFQGFLQNEDVTAMEIIPKETAFDPELHEAIASEPAEGLDGIILENYQDGYLFKGKVLRNAKVKVGQ